MIEKPLTPEEVAELDSYGELDGASYIIEGAMPQRAKDLWERELMYGREIPEPNVLGLL